MKITKKEALALAKVLHQHNPSPFLIAAHTQHDEVLAALSARVDRFILVDEADADYVDDEYLPEKSPAKKAEQPCDFYEGDEGLPCDDDSDDDEDEEHDCTSAASALHDLKPATGKAGTLEFEESAETVDLLVAGEPVVEDVTHVRRGGRLLEVKDAEGAWSSFEVSKFPKGWASLLPAGDLVKVGV